MSSKEENAGGAIPGKLTVTVVGKYTYYGNPKLVDRVIEQWKKKKMQGHGDKGLYGEVFKLTNTLLSPNIGIDNIQYYVKQVIPRLYEMPRMKGQPIGISAIDEIRFANELTAIVPDSVSNFKGARIINSGYPVITEEERKKKEEDLIVEYKLEEFAAFIVFEGLEGISLFDACEKVKNSGKTERQRLKDYATLFCSAKRAIESINTAGYTHGDIHNKNIIVIGDGDTAKCKLIDFGSTEKLATRRSLSTTVIQPKYTVDINALIKDCIHRYFFTDFFEYPLDYPNFKHETQHFLNLVVDLCGKRGTDFFRKTFITDIEQEYVNALGDFFFSLCGKLIRMRNIPGQITQVQNIMNRNISDQRLYTERKAKRNLFIKEKREYNTLFNTPNIPLPVANLNHELGSTLFGPNTTNLPSPRFLTQEEVPEVQGEVPVSVAERVRALEKKGGKRRKTRRQKLNRKRTRRV
jgi:serine/threonine protein kinase